MYTQYKFCALTGFLVGGIMETMRSSMDLVGQKIGRLLVIAEGPRSRHNKRCWDCLCDCGKRLTVIGETMRKTKHPTRSCGCMSRDRTRARSPNRRHGQSMITPGERSPAYRSWMSMNARCNRPTAIDYPRYGGVGITICERWSSFENFLADMGERPDGMTLDRRDGTKGYSPGNCRWATNIEQARNKKSVRLTESLAIEALGRLEHGEGPASIARRMGVQPSTISAIKLGKTWRNLPAFVPLP